MTILARLIDLAILTVILGVFINKHTEWLWEAFTKTAARSALSIGCIVLLVATRVMIYRSKKRQLLQQEFHVLRNAGELTPEDLNFEVVTIDQLGQSTAPRRPYVPGTYVQRTAIPYAQRHAIATATTYNEGELCQMLRAGTNVLLIGPPTDGKTRTLYELTDRMRDYSVVIPHHDAIPSQSSIELLRNKKVILLLDDLNAYDSSAINLISLYRSIGDVSTHCVMLAASRVSPDFMPSGRYESGLRRLCEYFEMLHLAPASIEQQKILESLLKQPEAETAPTLGSISMRGVFEQMIGRFASLPGATQDCFRALQLLAAAGIEPQRLQLAQIVISSIFDRDIDRGSVRDLIAELRNGGFISSSSTDEAIRPHSTYLVGPAAARFYRASATPQEDFFKLTQCFHESGDLNSANKVALALFFNGDRDSALNAWRKSATLSEGSNQTDMLEAGATALYHQGLSLGSMGDATAEVAAYDALLLRFNGSESSKVLSVIARAMSSKSRALAILGQYAEAVQANLVMEQRFGANENLEISISVARNREYRAGIYARMNDLPGADAAYGSIIKAYEGTTTPELQEVLAFAMTSQAKVWELQGQHDRAITRYDAVIANFSSIKRPGMAGVIAHALLAKATSLILQEKFSDAASYLQRIYRDFGAENNPEKLSIADRSAYALNAETIDEAVATALSNLHAIHILNGSYSEAKDTLNELLTRFAKSKESRIKSLIINSFRNRAAELFEVGNFVAAHEGCRDIGLRFASDPDIETRQECASRLFGIGDLLYRHYGRHDEAAKLFAYVAGLFKDDPALGLRVAVARAMVNLSVMSMKSGRNGEAISACDQVISYFGASSEPDLRAAVDTAYLNRSIAFGRMGVLWYPHMDALWRPYLEGVMG